MADHDNRDLTRDIAPISLPAFEHEPFTLMDSHIRLVRIINPGSQHIHLELQHAEIGEAVERGYDALSYTWGHDALQKDLIINGKHFVARDNLYQYLYRAKSAIPMDRCWGSWLWIDQICIDQSNLLERNQQVSIMSWIYSRAYSVTIWLGDQLEEHAHARYAMAMLRLLDDLSNDVSEFLFGGRQAHGKKTLADVKAMPSDDWHQWNRSGQIKYQTKVKLQDPSPFNTLLSNSYWTRLWIVQEVFLAARINIEW